VPCQTSGHALPLLLLLTRSQLNIEGRKARRLVTVVLWRPRAAASPFPEGAVPLLHMALRCADSSKPPPVSHLMLVSSTQVLLPCRVGLGMPPG
jgi:hypothetical protein